MPFKGKTINLTGKLFNVDLWFLLFALSSLILTFNKIVFGIGFAGLPIFFILLGFISYLYNQKKALQLFLLLLPIINALPYFFSITYPYNYMAIVVFYLSGLLIASIIKKEELHFNYNWAVYYLFFLFIIWISALFVFLKWSNLTLSSMAFLKDTLVEPGGTRVSFSSIFPILTLFFFSVSPYIALLLKKNKITGEKVFFSLLPGYCISVLIALYQKFQDPFFMKMKMKYWEKKATQFSGGFSDFNSFGFFSGVLFLAFIILLMNYLYKKDINTLNIKKILFYITGIIFSFIGIFISGSRAAFIFVIASLFLFILSKQIKKRIKIIVLIVLILISIAGGGILKQRVINTFSKLTKSFSSDNFVKSLDLALNGRIMMFQNSSMVLEKYPISGVGTGNFLFYLKNLKYKEKYYEDLPLNHYLLIFNENGFIGLFAFLLFIIMLIKTFKARSFIILFITIFIAIFFNNFFWFPEVLVLFWIIVSLGYNGTTSSNGTSKKMLFIAISLILGFIVMNITTFKELHPLSLTQNRNIHYDYGFWYLENDNNGNKYKWSKDESGIFLSLPKTGTSKKIKVFCGAPITHLEGRVQNLKIFWKGNLFKEINFKENRSVEFVIEDKPNSKGFLEFRISPIFNPSKLKLSDETRDLGVQVFMNQ